MTIKPRFYTQKLNFLVLNNHKLLNYHCKKKKIYQRKYGIVLTDTNLSMQGVSIDCADLASSIACSIINVNVSIIIHNYVHVLSLQDCEKRVPTISMFF